MKIGRFTLSGVSVALLILQLRVVSSIAGKYLYQRWRCPRVWTRAAAIDPNLPMRGRYLSLQLTVDGCQSTLPSAKDCDLPARVNGTVKPGPYVLRPHAGRLPRQPQGREQQARGRAHRGPGRSNRRRGSRG